jgi:hypothetical protein
LDVAARHRQFGWQLLAAAADGQIDLEALTELQIAWQRTETDKLLDGDGTALVLRSLWILTEVSCTLPDQPELKALAAHARKQSRVAAEKVLKALEGKPQDEAAFVATVYASLVFRDDGRFSDRALRAIMAGGASDSALGRARIVAQALLADPGDIDRQPLAELAAADISGEDMAVLMALAGRRAGGGVWNAFRARSKDSLGEQPLPGSIVVLISRLAGSNLPLVAVR